MPTYTHPDIEQPSTVGGPVKRIVWAIASSVHGRRRSGTHPLAATNGLQAISHLKVAVVFLVLLTGIDASGAVKNITRVSLPCDPAVQSAYDDVAKLESMVHSWNPRWEHATPREDVMSRIDASLKGLEKAVETSSNRNEARVLSWLLGWS